MRNRFALLILVFAGCEPPVVSLPTAEPPCPLITMGERNDSSQSGTLSGIVTWSDPVPAAAIFARSTSILDRDVVANPHALAVTDGKLAGAVVTLRGIDPSRGEAWYHAAVNVTLNDNGLAIHQGHRTGRVGFVKLGDEVTFTLQGTAILGVRARGDACFGTVLTPQQSTFTHRFTKPGRVELSSASGQYWAAAEIFVCEHPYYTVTDSAGRFEFKNVPAGEYEVSATHPNPAVIAREIDPETSVQVRQTYGPPFVGSQQCSIRAAMQQDCTLILK